MGFLALKAGILAAAKAYGYDPALLAAQAAQESAFNPLAISRVGAQGLMQFMPATWKDWGQGKDPFDVAASLDAGIRYMQSLLQRYRNTADPTALALAAYNCGMGRVDKAIQATRRTDWRGIVSELPAETQDYVPRILNRVAFYRGAFAVGIAGPVVILLAFLVFKFFRSVVA